MRSVGNAYLRLRLPSRVCWFTFTAGATHRVEQARLPPSSRQDRKPASARFPVAQIPEARPLRDAAATTAQPLLLVVAKRHSSSTVPSIPSIVASSSVTSSWRPGSTSALSITSLSTCVSPERRITFAPHGRTGCVTPSDCGASTWPQVVRCASPVAPREPANAMFQPAGAGALVRAAAPSSESRCSTIAAAAIADEERDRGEDDETLAEGCGHRRSVAEAAATPGSRRRAGSRARGAAPSEPSPERRSAGRSRSTPSGRR